MTTGNLTDVDIEDLRRFTPQFLDRVTDQQEALITDDHELSEILHSFFTANLALKYEL